MPSLAKESALPGQIRTKETHKPLNNKQETYFIDQEDTHIMMACSIW